MRKSWPSALTATRVSEHRAVAVSDTLVPEMARPLPAVV